MSTYTFSSLANGQHLLFDTTGDQMFFDSTSVSAGAVRLSLSGRDIGFRSGGKTVWLDGVALGEPAFGSSANVSFATASVLAVGEGTANLWRDSYGKSYDHTASAVGNQVWGLFGADTVSTGSGADWLVGNTALTSLNHVSRASSGSAPTSSSSATVSADGRFVAFAGGWTGFGSIDNNATDVIVKDISSSTCSRENLSMNGVAGNTGAFDPVISADGTALVFRSSSSNLVAGPASGANYDVYLTDVQGNGIVRVSTSSSFVLATDGQSRNPDVSPDRTVVAFHSTTSNWVAGGSVQTTRPQQRPSARPSAPTSSATGRCSRSTVAAATQSSCSPQRAQMPWCRQAS